MPRIACEDALAGKRSRVSSARRSARRRRERRREKKGGETVDAVEDGGSSAFRDGVRGASRAAGSLPSGACTAASRAGDLPHRSNSGNGMEAIAASARVGREPEDGGLARPGETRSSGSSRSRRRRRRRGGGEGKRRAFFFFGGAGGSRGCWSRRGRTEPAWKLAAETEAEALISSPNAMSRPMEIRADAQAGSLKRTSSYDGCAA